LPLPNFYFIQATGNPFSFSISSITLALASKILFTSTAYPVFFCKKLTGKPGITPPAYKPLVFISAVCFFLIAWLTHLEIHMIYGAPMIMMFISIGIFLFRPDLVLPGLLGGFSAMLLYGILCLLLLLVYPSIFSLTWHTEKFLNFAVFGIPIEEMLYGFTSGCIATVFYPYLFQYRFEKIRSSLFLPPGTPGGS
jgi:hypothetical protein